MMGLGNQSYRATSRPAMLMCYICGREFGTKSLEIHIKSCKQKFLNEEEKKPLNQRRKLPSPPSCVSLSNAPFQKQQFNEQAYNIYKNEALIKCNNCGRTFLPESLKHHSKACLPDKPFKPLNGHIPEQNLERSGSRSNDGIKSQDTIIIKPLAIMCYICGREYGTKSINIHIKTCKALFEAQESKKSPNQRRKLPPSPKNLQNIQNLSTQNLINFNNEAFEKYNNDVLEKCQNCGRTFKPDSLAHHRKACTEQKPFKPVKTEIKSENQLDNNIEQTQTQIQFNNKSSMQVENAKIQCYICKNQFIWNLLQKHVKQCTKQYKYEGSIPLLFQDICNLQNPSDYLLGLYNNQVSLMDGSIYSIDKNTK